MYSLERVTRLELITSTLARQPSSCFLEERSLCRRKVSGSLPSGRKRRKEIDGLIYGGQRKPKKPGDERFWGHPTDINTTYDQRGNRIDTKIGNNGRAVKERHYADHGYPKYHSNPHDHLLAYKPDGSPDWENSVQVNYFDGNVPEFKQYEGGKNVADDRPYTYENLKKQGCLEPEFSEYHKFESIAEFEKIMRHHAEVVFVYKTKAYSLTYIPGKIVFGETYYEGDDDLFDTSEEVLNYVMDDGKKLREIITAIQVVERMWFG